MLNRRFLALVEPIHEKLACPGRPSGGTGPGRCGRNRAVRLQSEHFRRGRHRSPFDGLADQWAVIQFFLRPFDRDLAQAPFQGFGEELSLGYHSLSHETVLQGVIHRRRFARLGSIVFDLAAVNLAQQFPLRLRQPGIPLLAEGIPGDRFRFFLSCFRPSSALRSGSSIPFSSAIFSIRAVRRENLARISGVRPAISKSSCLRSTPKPRSWSRFARRTGRPTGNRSVPLQIPELACLPAVFLLVEGRVEHEDVRMKLRIGHPSIGLEVV